MSLLRRIMDSTIQSTYDDNSTTKNYNESGDNNPSRLVDENTNFKIRPISLENLDEGVFNAFNNRFNIGNKKLGVILLDQEVASLKFQNAETFNEITNYLKLPYFVMWRHPAEPLPYRVSPTNKKVIYSIPRVKPQGIVYEEYISPQPRLQNFPYEFKFITVLRNSANEFEEQMLLLFKNNRIIIQIDGNRFELQPRTLNKPFTLGISKRGGDGTSMYVFTMEMLLTAYLRKREDIQKRERTNNVVLTIQEKESENSDLAIDVFTEIKKTRY